MTQLGKTLARTWAPYFGMDVTFKGTTDHHSSLVHPLFLMGFTFLSVANHVLVKSDLCLFPITKVSLLFHTFTSQKSFPAPKLPPTLSSFYLTPLIALLATTDNFLSGKHCGLGAQRRPLTGSWSVCPFQITDNSSLSHSRRIKWRG